MPTDTTKQIEYYASALKAPRIRDNAARLATQARDSNWTHEEYLAAVLSREVSARDPPAPNSGSGQPRSRDESLWRSSTSIINPRSNATR